MAAPAFSMQPNHFVLNSLSFSFIPRERSDEKGEITRKIELKNLKSMAYSLRLRQSPQDIIQVFIQAAWYLRNSPAFMLS